MKPLSKERRAPIISNHFSRQQSKNDPRLQEWFVSFIKRSELSQWEKNPALVIEDAVAPDSRALISHIWRNNRKNIDEKIGRHVLTGVTLYSSEVSKNFPNRIAFAAHHEFVMLLDKKNPVESTKLFSSGEKNFELLRFLNSNLKDKLATKGFLEIGYNKKYYNSKLTERLKVGDFSYLIYKGYKTAYDFYEDGLKLLVDYSTRIIHESSVWEDVQYYRNKKGMNDDQIIHDVIVGRSVWTTYGSQRAYRIDEVLTNLTINSPFPNPDFKSYKDYFMQRYKIKLNDPKQFLLLHNQEMKINTGKDYEVKINKIILPSEIVRATGIPQHERQNFQVMKEFARYTCLPPDERYLRIDELLNICNDSSGSSKKKANPFELRIDERSNQIEGIFIPKPRIMHSQGSGSVPAKDRIDLKRLYSQRPLTNWVLVSEPFMDRNIDAVIDNLVSSAGRFNIQMEDPAGVVMMPKSGKPEDLETNLKKIKGYRQPDIIFVLLGKRGSDRAYKNLKSYFNKRGIPMQFFISFNPKRDMKANSKYSNLVLQMINKLGGNLWCVEADHRNGLVLGVIVTHLNRGRSLICIVSQFDKNFTQIYSTSNIIKTQKSEAISSTIAEAVKNHCENYKKVKKSLPSTLVIYRQGTSEGQINNVVNEETQKLVKDLGKKYEMGAPKVLMTFVTKKVDDRFAVKEGRGLGNPQCGLVVDSGVVKSEYANFFMVAQFVNQGSANPTHYAVVYNETGMSMDELQKLTYNMCWAYTNWMGPIKIPSPLQYSNKLSALIAITQGDEIKESMLQTPYFL